MNLLFLSALVSSLLLNCRNVGADEKRSFPYFVFITDSSCHGVIISNRYVLTTAHCVADLGDGGVSLKTISSLVIYPVIRGTTYAVNKVIVHPYYGLGQSALPVHDIALLKTRVRIEFRRSIASIHLMKQRLRQNVDVVIPISSVDDDKNQLSKQYATVKSLNFNECARFHQSCAEYLLCVNNSYGVEFVTSGTPAIRKNKLVGIGCGKDRPNTFFSIAAYYDWIQLNLK